MRIIAGDAKGRGLCAPAGEQTRPTSDKIRGSIFNILSARTFGARVLDLFGGTGAMALEALSRGAEHAVIVDSDRRAIEAIQKNAASVVGLRDSRVRIFRADYRRALSSMTDGAFDLVFLDPPYAMDEAYSIAARLLLEGGRLAEDCVIVMERAKRREICPIPGFEIYDTRVYGDTAVDFARRSSE